MINELILKNRSYRRFHQEIAISRETLKELVDLARLSSSGANLQPLKYILSWGTGNYIVPKSLARIISFKFGKGLLRVLPRNWGKGFVKSPISCDPQRNTLIFPHLSWAGYLKDWPGPSEGERPPAYIIILGDTEIRKTFECDHGIAAQSILLGATEKGLGGCIIGSIDREGLRAALNISSRYEILLVLALGIPRETVVLETVDSSGDIKYWRDGEGRHHVPKRKLDEIIID